MQSGHIFSSLSVLCWALCAGPAHAQSVRSEPAPAVAPSPPAPSSAEHSKPVDSTIQLQLLEGVRLFRAERYEDALRVFQQVNTDEKSTDIGFYLGMVLHKLGRHSAALIAFRSTQRSGLREPVADYYAAVSCYRLGMNTRARRGFASLATAASGPAPGVPPLGPRLQQGARNFLSALQSSAADMTSDGGSSSIHLQYERARQAAERLLASDDAEGALEWIDEAGQILEESPDPRERAEHSDELRGLLNRLRSKPGSQVRTADVQALEQRFAH